ACLAVRTPPAAVFRSALHSASGPPNRPGRPAPVARTALTPAERSEHIVSAGGRVVAGEGRQQVGAGEAAQLDVQAATLTLAVTPPEAGGTPEGEVVTDRGTLEGEGRECVLEDPAPLAIGAVAAGTASAAEDEIVVHGAAADGEHRPEEIG